MKTPFLALLIVLSSCSGAVKNQQTYYDYSDVETIIDWYDSFNQKENDYLVYYYSVTCSHCNSIKQEIITYYFSEAEPLYFVNTNLNSRFGPTIELTGTCDIDLFYIFGTPFLIRVKEYMVADYYPGVGKILEYLDQQK